MPTDERVLCIPTAHFRAAGYFHGFRRADDAYRAALFAPAAFTFRPRAEAETDPAFKQVIPYLVFRCGDLVFHYRRGAAGTEERLRSLRSVGVGGHVNEGDCGGASDPYRAGLLRELEEEVEVGAADYEGRLFGFINDDRTFVGSVHLGAVHLFDLSEPAVTPREDALTEPGFAPVARLAAEREGFETWSQFVLEALSGPGA